MLQLLDMDIAPETWNPPEDLIPRQALCGVPHHGLGRGFKVGKEEIVGLIVALQRFVTADAAVEIAAQERQLAAIAQRLSDVPHVRLRHLPATETGRHPLLELRLDESALGRTVWEISLELQGGDPPIHLNERRAAERILTVNPAALRDGDEHVVATRLRAVLMGRV
ncbi:MAG TPA: hypothetical protein VLM91_16825 [Candidatus Methylomirabilis sp.]|nr:hypothetical protein [Candidatus Methylomirabilis sp.]